METRNIYWRPIGNPLRKYRQDHFIISNFKCNFKESEEVKLNDLRRTIVNLKKTGYNTLELGWAGHNNALAALPICEEEGIDLILQDFTEFGGFQKREPVEVSEMHIKEYVEKHKKYRRLSGYYIWDEPWLEDSLENAGRQISWFEKYDPFKLPFTVALPSYNPDFTWINGKYPSYVKRYSEMVNPAVFSFDYYPFGVDPVRDDSAQLDNSFLWLDLGIVTQEARVRNIPFWFYFQDLRVAKFRDIDFPMIRLQMYNALMYGAKALQSYNATGSACSPGKESERSVLKPDGTKGYFYEDTKNINFEMQNLGRTLMALESYGVYHSSEVLKDNDYFNENFRKNIKESGIFASDLPKKCSVGLFKDKEDNDYVLILNRDYLNSNKFILPLKFKVRLYEVSKNDGMQREIGITDKINIALSPGDGILYRLQDWKKESCLIEYFLEK
ncbi:MAG: hypothetical protein Q8882_03275 [Bacillota bacterium]|nr:hypothetical protein [Bacillota bacterium]